MPRDARGGRLPKRFLISQWPRNTGDPSSSISVGLRPGGRRSHRSQRCQPRVGFTGLSRTSRSAAVMAASPACPAGNGWPDSSQPTLTAAWPESR